METTPSSGPHPHYGVCSDASCDLTLSGAYTHSKGISDLSTVYLETDFRHTTDIK